MRVTMYNPLTSVTITTNDKYQAKWERLGFIVLDKVIMFPLSA